MFIYIPVPSTENEAGSGDVPTMVLWGSLISGGLSEGPFEKVITN
jgi:hypothetical protein